MQFIETPAYRKAFIQYLRRGTPLELSLKAMAKEKPTTHYIWHTSGDDKVRPSHAVNNGRIFSWDNPPETGHPGEDYNCRCSAEPYYGNQHEVYDPPIEPVYPELVLVPLLRVGRGAASLAGRLLQRIRGRGKLKKPDSFTEHGAVRSAQRRISSEEAQEAIRTAKEAGNVVEKIGKYGTPQLHYKGQNGVTVIVETTGRNAGKIITFWRH